jgi:hypothetical protein
MDAGARRPGNARVGFVSAVVTLIFRNSCGTRVPSVFRSISVSSGRDASNAAGARSSLKPAGWRQSINLRSLRFGSVGPCDRGNLRRRRPRSGTPCAPARSSGYPGLVRRADAFLRHADASLRRHASSCATATALDPAHRQRARRPQRQPMPTRTWHEESGLPLRARRVGAERSRRHTSV